MLRRAVFAIAALCGVCLAAPAAVAFAPLDMIASNGSSGAPGVQSVGPAPQLRHVTVTAATANSTDGLPAPLQHSETASPRAENSSLYHLQVFRSDAAPSFPARPLFKPATTSIPTMEGRLLSPEAEEIVVLGMHLFRIVLWSRCVCVHVCMCVCGGAACLR